MIECFEQHPIAACDLNDLHVTCLSVNEQHRPHIKEVCESIQRLQSKLLNMDAARHYRGANGEESARGGVGGDDADEEGVVS